MSRIVSCPARPTLIAQTPSGDISWLSWARKFNLAKILAGQSESRSCVIVQVNWKSREKQKIWNRFVVSSLTGMVFYSGFLILPIKAKESLVMRIMIRCVNRNETGLSLLERKYIALFFILKWFWLFLFFKWLCNSLILIGQPIFWLDWTSGPKKID